MPGNIARTDPLKPRPRLGLANRSIVPQKGVEGEIDADKIKSKVVSATPPTDGQVLTYDASLDQIVPRDVQAIETTGGHPSRPTHHPRDFEATVSATPDESDYPTIPAAIAAGKRTVFVRNGSYAGFTVAATSALVYMAAESEDAIITGNISVEKACILERFRVQPTSATIDVEHKAAGIEFRKMRFQGSGGFGVRCKPPASGSVTNTHPKWIDCVFDGNPSGVSAITDIRTGSTRVDMGNAWISRCRFENMNTGTVPVVDLAPVGGLSGTSGPEMRGCQFTSCTASVPLVMLRANTRAIFDTCSTDKADGGFVACYGTGLFLCTEPVIRIATVPAGVSVAGIDNAVVDCLISNPLCIVQNALGAGATYDDIRLSDGVCLLANVFIFSSTARTGRTGINSVAAQSVGINGGMIGGCDVGMNVTGISVLQATMLNLDTNFNNTDIVGRVSTHHFINCLGTGVQLGGSVLGEPQYDNAVSLGTATKRVSEIYSYFVNVATRIDPDADLGADLGTTALRWLSLYARDIFGSAVQADYNELLLQLVAPGPPMAGSRLFAFPSFAGVSKLFAIDEQGTTVGPFGTMSGALVSGYPGAAGGFSVSRAATQIDAWGLLVGAVEAFNAESTGQLPTDNVPYYQQDTLNVTNSDAYLEWPVNTPLAALAFTYGFQFVATTSVRGFIGYTDQTAATMLAADNPAGNYVGLSYSSARGDTTWKIATKDGTTQTLTDTTVARNTGNYGMRIVNDQYTGEVVVTMLSLLGTELAAPVRISATLPTTVMRLVAGHRTLAATAKSLRHAFAYTVLNP